MGQLAAHSHPRSRLPVSLQHHVALAGILAVRWSHLQMHAQFRDQWRQNSVGDWQTPHFGRLMRRHVTRHLTCSRTRLCWYPLRSARGLLLSEVGGRRCRLRRRLTTQCRATERCEPFGRRRKLCRPLLLRWRTKCLEYPAQGPPDARLRRLVHPLRSAARGPAGHPRHRARRARRLPTKIPPAPIFCRCTFCRKPTAPGCRPKSLRCPSVGPGRGRHRSERGRRRMHRRGDCRPQEPRGCHLRFGLVQGSRCLKQT
mmetsp:Transcript_103911/g.298572  ORF Transcript_103911/g.298572 Transcript_103911/m.298572 type:complete len:257 (-) Transcript_103911:1233-2003(-)